METVLTTAAVEQGTLRGVPSARGDVVAFKGVPYAAPPVGALRWRLPRPPEAWDGIRPAYRFGPACPQQYVLPHSLLAGGQDPQDEDCLYLNVWTAATDRAESRPVAVFLHPGGFRFGSGAAPLYDGEELARAGVVVVTVNYRLNRFGFLAHPALSRETGSSGNYGLYDQLAALEWLRANAAAFGGDPRRVTLFGVSAGACSINLLMATRAAEGLFHRAIGHSGAQMGTVGATSNVADELQDLESAERTGLAVAKALGARSADNLRAVSAEALMAAEIRAPGVVPWSRRGSDGAFFRGSLDSGYPIVDGTLIARRPLDVYVAGDQLRIPLITGAVTNEGSGSAYLPTVRRYLEDTRIEYGPLANDFLAVYPAASDEEAQANSAASFGDRMSTAGTWAWARTQAAVAPTFYYHFAHTPPVPRDTYAEGNPGAYHGAEIPYVFRNFGAFDWEWGDDDRALSERMSTYWVNFARTGDPNGAGLPEWRAFAPGDSDAMTFGAKPRMAQVPRRDRLEFWDRFYGRTELLG
ncbi:carboxylesterase/lipase family protein [Streptomyces sp. NPDC001984]